MTRQALDLLQKALSLSEGERPDLACSLMESLDASVDQEAESAWTEEISRRIAEREKRELWENQRFRRKVTSAATRQAAR
jgi:putative addiction module component